MSFHGKVALVTGGAQGIGRATALAFAREGAGVVVADINQDAALETVRLAKTEGVEAIFVSADMTSHDQVRNMVETTVARFGRLDCAVNNAGHPSFRTNAVDCTEDEWDLVMTLNVTSVRWCMRYQIPAMLQSGGGAIVNVSSGAGLFASPSMAAYTASKHAVLGLSRSAAVDFGRHNVRVNVLHPGTTETEMMSATAEAMRAKGTDIMPGLLERNPLGRLATSDEQAQAALWLCSDRASYANGVSLVMDGGLAVLR
jgi:NAD(P)-dependent dehydrogenase (short-subunit alcohol dehydrogenase family)